MSSIVSLLDGPSLSNYQKVMLKLTNGGNIRTEEWDHRSFRAIGNGDISQPAIKNVLLRLVNKTAPDGWCSRSFTYLAA